MNHFASQWMGKANVIVVETENESDDEYCLTLDSVDESEMISVHATSDHEYLRKLFATISLGNSRIQFQLDSGATCNLLPAKYFEDWKELTPTGKWLIMYNNTIMKPLGTCTLQVLNPKNSYYMEFLVVDNGRLFPILGNQTMQQMDLVGVQHHNVISINTRQVCLTAKHLSEVYPDVFQGTGKLVG